MFCSVCMCVGVHACMCAAVEVARKSLELDDGLWQCHYWYALAVGSQVRFQSIQKKIVGGYEYKVTKSQQYRVFTNENIKQGDSFSQNFATEYEQIITVSDFPHCIGG